MNSGAVKLTGINCWFFIEIMSFYGYILSAWAFIFETSIKSSLGWSKYRDDNKEEKDRYKVDFIKFYRKDIDWLAFVTILFQVNICLILVDYLIVFTGEKENLPHPLRHSTFILLGNHGLQMIFLRQFYDEKRRVNTKNNWLWGVHFVFYVYVIWAYYFSGKLRDEPSDNIKIWIPLDILLTFNITLYQVYYNWEQTNEDEMLKAEEEEENGIEMTETEPSNLNTSLLN